ncbi:MAG: bifunctional demethylmenaquinone methyltransferase/2-methoxy-6-polyprenyl-1,4-benzoquinol methylase UbiE [Sedimentisphaerales bacterium]|nr:bifunctional demethylmenaquinone methyltransferase/2-methoxy-6-polyprenyl-1,4-benzoquinol methylase UbiE [Sedimentisphaerales bacterium]
MFDRIATVYDKLNHILSFGMDFFWRTRLAGMVEKKKQLKILDLATGTGDLLIAILRKNPNITEAIGLDISENMLAICKKKIAAYNLSQKVKLIRSDADSSGLPDNTYDLITMGFGIRNTPDSPKTLSEIFRLLNKNGTALILEFSIPSNRLIKFLYILYLRIWVPFIGRFVSGDKKAYRYLNTSIEEFHNMKEFSSLMQKTGFKNITATPLAFGIACIYQGSKINS